jgi:type I restriction enzyme S subunit
VQELGEAAMVNQDLDFAFYVSIGLLKPVQDYVYSPYIVHWLNSPDGVASSRKNTLGKGHSQGNLNLNLIRKFVLPLPPLSEQHRIVAYLDKLQAKVDTMKRLREEAMKELDALLPSILDKAFKGEL